MRPLWRPLWRGLRWVAGHNDVVLGLLALAMFVIGWSTIQISHDVPASLMPVLALAEAVPLLLLRRAPFVGWGIATAVSVLWWALVPAYFSSPMPWPVVQFLVLLATIVAVGLWGRWREIPIVIAGTGVLCVAALPDDLKPWALGQAVVMGVALLVRWLVLSRRQIAVQKDEVETERARRAVVEERSRIARELHDVVAHHMSMIVVQAQSAPIRHGVSDPEVVGGVLGDRGFGAAGPQRGAFGAGGAARRERTGRDRAPTRSRAASVSGQGLQSSGYAAHLPFASRPGPGAPGHGAGALSGGAGVPGQCGPARSWCGSGAHARGGLGLGPAHGPQLASARPRQAAGVRNVGEEGDQYRGRNGDDETGGNGIRGMFERVRAVGGTFEAEPVGAGFVVIATVPLTGRPQVAGLG